MFQLSATLAIWAALVTPAAIAVFVVTRTRIEQCFTKVQEQLANKSPMNVNTPKVQRLQAARTVTRPI